MSLPLGKKSKKKKKEKCAIEANESIRKNSKKKRKRGKVSDPLNIHSAESFYSFILSWAVSEVRNDQSMVSSLPPLPICIRRFDSSQEYLDTMLSICLEECRANLQISSRLIDSSKHIGSSMTINSKSMSTGYVTLTNILCIDCRIQSITDGSFNEDYSHLQSKLSFKTALAVHKPGMIYLLQLQIGPSVVIEQFCMLRSCLDNEQLECQTGGINTSCMITLSLYVVYPSSLFQQFEALPNGSCITLHSCCSLLSYQRMIVGVSRSANAAPSLVDKLASTISLSKHIRFVDSEEGGAVAINNTECNFTSKEQNVSTQKYKSFLDLLLPKGTLPGSISLLLQSLNDSQLAAISRLLNPIAESVDSKLRGHVNLIQGPPGD